MSDTFRSYTSAQKSHTHDDFHQIILPITGNLDLEINGHNGIVSGQTIAIVACGEKHAFRAKGDNNFLVLDIANDKTNQGGEQLWDMATQRPFHFMSGALSSLCNYATLYQKQATNPNSWQPHWQALFLTTLHSDLVDPQTALPARINKTVEYMQANLAHPISNTDLASIACLSPARFYELFRQSMNMTPQQYLTNLRLQTAKRLIRQGENLSLIAMEVGFGDQSAFGRAFQKAYGLSPGKWRKQESGTKFS